MHDQLLFYYIKDRSIRCCLHHVSINVLTLTSSSLFLPRDFRPHGAFSRLNNNFVKLRKSSSRRDHCQYPVCIISTGKHSASPGLLLYISFPAVIVHSAKLDRIARSLVQGPSPLRSCNVSPTDIAELGSDSCVKTFGEKCRYNVLFIIKTIAGLRLCISMHPMRLQIIQAVSLLSKA